MTISVTPAEDTASPSPSPTAVVTESVVDSSDALVSVTPTGTNAINDSEPANTPNLGTATASASETQTATATVDALASPSPAESSEDKLELTSTPSLSPSEIATESAPTTTATVATFDDIVCQWDVDGDGSLTPDDLVLIANSPQLGTEFESPLWIEAYDLNFDNTIDIVDLQLGSAFIGLVCVQ